MWQHAFKMNLSSGNVEEYMKRHHEIDHTHPDISKALKAAGVSNYSIFYDPQTKILFALWHMTEDNTIDDLANHPAVKEWWAFMNDGIMEYNAKGQPVAVTLERVFHLA